MHKNYMPERKVIFEFSPDKFFDILHSVLNLIILEKKDFERKIVNTLNLFRQDVEAFKKKDRIELLDGRYKDIYKEKFTIEFGSEEYFNAVYSLYNSLINERAEMDKRHIRIIEEIQGQIKEYL